YRLILDGKWQLHSIAAGKVAERNMHHVDKPAKAERNEFAKRHQMMLVVAIRFGRNAARRGWRQAEYAISILLRPIADGDADGEMAIRRCGKFGQTRQIVG